MKIAIEGMDGVGKTTVAKIIADKLNYIYIEKPIINFLKTDNYNSKALFPELSSKICNMNSEVLKAWFFGLGNIYTFINYENEDIVIDRHFVSNYFWNGTQNSEIIFKTMMDLVGLPDITIVLYASWDVRKERIKMRNKNDFDLNDPEIMVYGYDKMCDFLNKYSFPYYLINTENKDIDTIVNDIIQIVNNYKKSNQVLSKSLNKKE